VAAGVSIYGTTAKTEPKTEPKIKPTTTPVKKPNPANFARKQVQSEQQKTSGQLLLDLGDASQSTPDENIPRAVTTPIQNQQKANNSGSSYELLSSIFDSPASDAGALLMADTSTSSLPVAVLTPSAPTGILVGGGHKTTNFNKITLPPNLQNQMESAEKSHESNKLLIEDTRIAISYYKVFRQEDVLLVLFISNKSPAQLNTVNITLKLPTNLTVMYGGDPGPFVQNNVISYSYIVPQSTIFTTLSFKLKDYAVSMSLSAILTYSTEKPKQEYQLSFAIPILIIDLLRPIKTSTDQFAEKWKQTTQEKKLKLKSATVTTPTELMAKLQNQLHLFPVKIIDIEAIACGKLAGSQDICLVHGKISAGPVIDVTIRTRDRVFTESVANTCQSLF